MKHSEDFEARARSLALRLKRFTEVTVVGNGTLGKSMVLSLNEQGVIYLASELLEVYNQGVHDQITGDA